MTYNALKEIENTQLPNLKFIFYQINMDWHFQGSNDTESGYNFFIISPYFLWNTWMRLITWPSYLFSSKSTPAATEFFTSSLIAYYKECHFSIITEGVTQRLFPIFQRNSSLGWTFIMNWKARLGPWYVQDM